MLKLVSNRLFVALNMNAIYKKPIEVLSDRQELTLHAMFSSRMNFPFAIRKLRSKTKNNENNHYYYYWARP